MANGFTLAEPDSSAQLQSTETIIPLHVAEPPLWRVLALVGLAAAAWLVAWLNIERLAGWLTYDLAGLAEGSHLGESLAFFLYDVPKILLLLAGMIFLVTLLRSFFSPEQTRQLLGGKRQGVGNVLAALLGVVTPFCSCSAVPLFIGFVESGIPLGVTFSFLISTPMVNEVALVMLLGLFGWKIAGLYMGMGLLVAVLAGMVIGRLHLERYVEDFVWQLQMAEANLAEVRPSWQQRIDQAWVGTKQIVGKVWLFVIVGIAVGAGIHGFVPEDALAGILGKSAWWSVPAGVLLGIPMYSNAAGVIPVVHALMEKGAALGTVLAFMMSVVALSLPETIILRRVLKPQLIVVFLGIVGVGIMLTGFLFNAVI